MIPDFSAYTYRLTTTNLANSATSLYNNGNLEYTFVFTGTYQTGSGYGLPINSYADNMTGYTNNDNYESGYYASCMDGVC